MGFLLSQTSVLSPFAGTQTNVVLSLISVHSREYQGTLDSSPKRSPVVAEDLETWLCQGNPAEDSESSDNSTALSSPVPIPGTCWASGHSPHDTMNIMILDILPILQQIPTPLKIQGLTLLYRTLHASRPAHNHRHHHHSHLVPAMLVSLSSPTSYIRGIH